jgi:type I restriction-modification system DNA methylase subunit
MSEAGIMLKTYFKRIFDVAKRGDAREESYYSLLEELLRSYAVSINKKHVHVTTLPKKTDAGNPDFRIWDGKQQIIGYIEAKTPPLHPPLARGELRGVEYLDQIEASGQLKRYLNIFPNLLLTNFFEFRLYRNGSLIDKVQIGRPYHIHKLKSVPLVENEEKFFSLLEKYFSFSLPKVYDAKNLAIELAKRTRFLKDEVISQELEEEEKKGKGNILGFYKVFKEHLISGLTKEDFADLYSQTIAYGLFAARTRTENGFNRKLAYDKIPRTIGILRDVFKFISLEDLPQQMEWIIDDISEVLAVTDVYKLLDEYFNKHKGKDPIVHFYETFLAEYDPKTREKRGVYYTPEPVVSYIVRSLHHILKEHFDKNDGFASQSVTVLDPAAGTLTFLAEAAKLAVDEFTSKYGEGKRRGFIKEHILKNFYAFELMMAPYAVGHLKMSFLLEELGYKLQADDRFKLYLTNTLEMEELAQTELPGMVSLSEESHLAGKVKKEQPILVILGNPPYSVSSANKSDFIEKEMDIYKEDVRDERNIQPLSDDYIKFIRFAHWKIENAGKGVIGMITNNSYLSGLIHRGMRKSLLESFNEIYILNLHGNSRIGEKCPDGSKDENVFDIQQGVSIVLFVKNPPIPPLAKGDKGGFGKVFYQDVYGLREKKQGYLSKYEVTSTKWKRLRPSEPYYFFVEKDFAEQARHNKFWSIQSIFVQSSSGVKTHRDQFLVGFTQEEVKQKMRTFTGNLPDELVAQSLNLKDTRDWKLKIARESLKKIDWKEYIRTYSYRPFDNRQICYIPDLIDRGCDRWDLMKNFFEENIGIILRRTAENTPDWRQVFVCENVMDINFLTAQTYVFPLYIYQEKKDNPKKRSFSSVMMLFEEQAEYSVKKPNLSPVLIEKLTKEYGKSFAVDSSFLRKQESRDKELDSRFHGNDSKYIPPEEIFYYIYAVLYSNIYRTKYSEFLKIDFPRVPFTKDYKLFKKIAEFGERLVELHLLKSSELDKPITRFQGEGNDKIEKVRYEEGKLCINQSQYFEDIPSDVWAYQIGGYQVCDKWLKDRKGRKISVEETQHFCRVVTALKKTIEVQAKIDSIYHEIEKEIIEA